MSLLELPYNIPGGQQVQFTPYNISGRNGGDATVIGSGALSSENYVAGTSGWRIDGAGNVEFESGEFRGDISGASGTFSSTIDIGGADATSFHVDIGGNMWLGAAIYADAPFKVSSAGALVAASGSFSAGVYTGTNTVTNNVANTLQSGNYVAASAGWQITGSGVAEFGSINARGTIRTGVSGARVDIGFTNTASILLDHGVAYTGDRPYILAQDNGTSGSLFIVGPEQANDSQVPYITLEATDSGTTQAIGLFGDAVVVSGQLQVPAGTVSLPSVSVGATNNGIYATNTTTVDVAAGGVRIAAFYNEGEVNFQDGILYDGIGGTHFFSFYYSAGQIRGVAMAGGVVVADLVLG